MVKPPIRLKVHMFVACYPWFNSPCFHLVCQELQQLLSPQCNALHCEALLRMALAKQQRERSSGGVDSSYRGGGGPGIWLFYGIYHAIYWCLSCYLMGFMVFSDQLQRQETPNRVGGRKPMCQTQATVPMER